MKNLIIITMLLLSVACTKDDNLKWPKELVHPSELCDATWINIDSLDCIESIIFYDLFNKITIVNKNSELNKYLNGWSYDYDHRVVINNSDIIINPIVFECYIINDTLNIIWDDRIILFKDNFNN